MYQYLKIDLDGQAYESDLVSMQSSVNIDSVSHRMAYEDESGDVLDSPSLKLYLTSSIDDRASKYYIYSFEETWKAQAGYSRNRVIKPVFTYDENHNPIDINFDIPYEGNTTYCYPYIKTDRISVLSTEGLSRNQIIDVPIFAVNLRSSRLLDRYSVLVNQYSVSQEVYHFLNMLQEFSENSGFLYDIQPGFVEGNIHNISTPEENVIGMFYASSHNSSRIFLSNHMLPPRVKSIVNSSQPACDPVSCGHPNYGPPILPIRPAPSEELNEGLQFLRDTLLIKKGYSIYDYYEIEEDGTTYLLLQMASPPCVDCRVYGTNIEPIWWEEN